MMTALNRMASGRVEMPRCNFHQLYGQSVIAEFYGLTTEGVSAYMCGNCFQDFGVGLGNGLGRSLDEDILE